MASIPAPFEVDLDTRLLEVWMGAWGCLPPSVEELGALLRWAYGRGYTDALSEPEPGQLCRDHGYAVPRRSD